MATPYHPNLTDDTKTFPGTASLFDPSIVGVLKGDGSTKLGSKGVEGGNDPDLSSAINALAYDDEQRWPEEGGSNIPLKTWLVDCPDANLVVNFLGRARGFLDGTVDPLITPPAWFTVASLDASGTVPYVNPANSSNPDAIVALNHLLDDADYKL